MALIDRRSFLAGSVPWLAAMSSALAAADDSGVAGPDGEPAQLDFGPPQPFGYDALRQRAKDLAKKSYVAPAVPAAKIVQTIDFDAIQKIKFRPQYALWAGGPDRLPVRFFHLDKYVGEPVTIHAVQGGQAREVLYATRYFDYGSTGLAEKLPNNLGFSGFRVMNGHASKVDWLAFQGASYFRSAGAENQYGLSARGIALDTALSTREEFPRFTEFWLAETGEEKRAITIFALLEGPSVTGAYRFAADGPGNVVMDVHADLFIRADIQRLGLAPLTSMYWYGENDRRKALDWRPEVHDSDGLALWTGKGERIWRPLIDPPKVQTNSFVDANPKGFGLMQRDRRFNDYQDDSAFYERRPSTWVEPLGNWGEGAVQLVEIPTDDEIHDNIVAYWQPHAPVKSGDNLSLDYRLYWQEHDPHPPENLGHVVATRVGSGGVPGQPRPKNQWKFVIDFQGGPLQGMQPRYDVAPVVTVSRGKVVNPYVIKIVDSDRWRAVFDVAVEGKEPLDLRCFLRVDGRTLTETWLYQYFIA